MVSAGPRVVDMSQLSSEQQSSKSLKTERRDFLRKIESEMQAKWEREKTFEVECDPTFHPSCDTEANPAEKDKYFCTFPYPYMNGRLHIGHAFTITKSDFAAGYQRLQGKRVLFPFAFHCTGMPIQAAANKLKREIEDYGIEACRTGVFDGGVEAAAKAAASKDVSAEKLLLAAAGGGPRGKKTKLAVKSGGVTRQWTILQKNGIADSEIPAFVDPEHWLRYFPPYGMQDLKKFGLHTDWRRSFITTKTNPYYDSFIRWQFRVLKEAGKIAWGRRPTIYSITDGQACADHDRSCGEGVNPQGYTLIKLRLLSPKSIKQMCDLNDEEAKQVYLVAATLRPETMYGQTNLFVLPDGEYGVYRTVGKDGKQGEIFICSKKSALNLSYQDKIEPRGRPDDALIAEVSGYDLLGQAVAPPMSVYEQVYILPLLTISMDKGTGIVTSVPSDAPDDYAALKDLQNDATLREKYGITEEMVCPFDVLPIIKIPGGCPALGIDDFGPCAAQTCCEVLGVKNQHDKKKLKAAKDACYLRGFNFGVMDVGSQKGKLVSEAKELVKAEMLASGDAALYYEPADKVISRSGDECVVAMLQQWYLGYGEEKWRDEVLAHVTKDASLNLQEGKGFNAYTTAARKQYVNTLNWLGEWACSRNFGLGTQVPWDEQFVIESLSDSTIYMSYYTIAHMLQGADNVDGTKIGPLGITPEQLTHGVWDYIFRNGKLPDNCDIPEASLFRLRQSFAYWYPMDLRVSGKDLIRNHLTMSLYNHAAIWPGQSKTRWNQSYFTNGHVMVDNVKMSKSKGNFITLTNAIESNNVWRADDGSWQPQAWSSDAVRFALADAGDGLEDSNFSSEVANMAVINLTKELDWMKTMSHCIRTGAEYCFGVGAGSGKLRPASSPLELLDRVFIARMKDCVDNAKREYEGMFFMLALKYACHEMRNARDEYRSYYAMAQTSMHELVIQKFMETQVIILSPICPHWSEFIWCGEEYLNRSQTSTPSVMQARWPVIEESDPAVLAQWNYVQKRVSTFRQLMAPRKVKAKKNKPPPPPRPVPKHAAFYVQKSMEPWRCELLSFLSKHYDSSSKTSFDLGKKEMLAAVREYANTNELLKGNKMVMKVASFVMGKEVAQFGAAALETSMPFDEIAALRDNAAYITKSLKLESIPKIYDASDETASGDSKKRAQATMGKPTAFFW